MELFLNLVFMRLLAVLFVIFTVQSANIDYYFALILASDDRYIFLFEAITKSRFEVPSAKVKYFFLVTLLFIC